MRLSAAAGGVGLALFGSLSLAACEADAPAKPSNSTTAFRLTDNPKSDCGREGPQSAASLPVPRGAAAVRLCAREDALTWRPPHELLTADVEGLVHVINAQRPVDSDVCTLQGGLAFELLLAYPNGQALAVPGHTGGCDDLDLAGDTYGDASTVLDAFTNRVEGQRSSSRPPQSYRRVRLGCGGSNGRAMSLIGEPTAMVRAISCWRANAAELPPFERSALRGDELRRILNDVRPNTVPQEKLSQPVCASSGLYYWQVLVGQTEWGDMVQIAGTCDEFEVRPGEFWKASPSSRTLLQQLRERGSRQ